MITSAVESLAPANLAPAKWIWLPSERCLGNTFVLFRRELELRVRPKRATGWLTADSRYRLTVNGRRVQWGPAPCDPRWQEVDPVDLTPYLDAGRNVIGIEVCYFGHGDGTWAMGSPGLICRLEIDDELVVSDSSWQTRLDRAHRPGMYKRWFLRALQEEFDARRHPFGWDTPSFQPGNEWLPAAELPGAPDKPAIFAGGPEYDLMADDPAKQDAEGQLDDIQSAHLRHRSIPLMRETWIAAKGLVDSGRVCWQRDPDDWFESRIPGSFTIERDSAGRKPTALNAGEGLYFTYEMPEQIAGFPGFTINAPAGTIVELIVQESHDPENGPLWLDNYLYHWSRFICREGANVFETFDYESFRWIQLHVRETDRPVEITNVGVRRRVYDWANPARIECGEPTLQRLFDATVNTLCNCALETNQDGAGRERQQYSGDVGHQQHAIRYSFGEYRHGARYLKTYSQGLTLDGYFLDCWPGYDRLARLMQRQMGATIWGPILDHGIGFNFDCWHHYLESGDLDALREPYPRLCRFARYLDCLRRDDGLLPVENLGVPSVWIDHNAYRQQRHKQCAFNLYAAAMLQHALAPIAEALGDDPSPYRQFGREIEAAAVARFWNASEGVFVVGDGRLCDRSLATAILYDQCPGGDTSAALRALVECPPNLGVSYPANAIWRYWALNKCGRTDVIINELRDRWATMNSVLFNNTLQENWHTHMDSRDQFSHCPVAPLIVLHQCIAGIRPTSPGFTSCEIRPQLGDLGRLAFSAHTPQGVIAFSAEPAAGGHKVAVTVPDTCRATIVSGSREAEPVKGSWQGFIAGQ
jgi:alpha-L-rhamnosidase